jgi:hypothetical protein
MPMKKFPRTPFPLIGEIVYECAIRSGLVSSNEDTKLYADLKALKDDRKRPALRPITLPLEILVTLEERLAKYTGSEMYACMTFVQVRRVLENYAFSIAGADATLLTRQEVEDQILWPTLFSAAAAACLSPLDKIWHVSDLNSLLEDKAPFGRFLRGLCVQGPKDYRLICEYRSQRHGIDPENCEQTLRTWLSGTAVPTLDCCDDILNALGMQNDSGTRQWVLVARLLGKTDPARRAHIRNRLLYEPREPLIVQFHQLRRAVAWEAGKKLNIGRDRPFSKIKEALYNAEAPRDPKDIESMLERLRVTWEPIADRTQQSLDWLWGRFHVLNSRYAEALERYQSAYELGFGRDRDILEYALNELVALAGKLGKWRAAQKYHDVACLYGAEEWDGRRESSAAFFNAKFPRELFFTPAADAPKE